MLACKETAVIHFFALGVAGFAPGCCRHAKNCRPEKWWPSRLLVFLFVAILLFTWFGRHWSVFADLLHAIPRFAARAGGEGHAKPFGYYFHLLDPMLVLVLVAAGGAYAAIWDAVQSHPQTAVVGDHLRAGHFFDLLGHSLQDALAGLEFVAALALACGLGVAAFLTHIHSATGRWVLGIAGLFLLAVLAGQTKALVFDRPADENNPYAYAHTSEDLLGLPPRLEQLARANHLPQPRIAVIAADAWPLPWYLRKFSNVGYWQPGQETGPADFFITTTDLSDELKARLKDFRPEFFGVRPGVLILLWIPPSFKTSP